MVFQCYSAPIAIKPTNYIIKIPDSSQFDSDRYFANKTLMRRIPHSSEYESFDRFVDIISKGLEPAGKVFLYGCDTAVETDHPQKHFANSLACCLPNHTVIGTTQHVGLFDNFISDGPMFIRGFKLKPIKAEYIKT